MFDSNASDETCKKAINKLDKQISDIMAAAEKKCTAVSCHHLDSWSPESIQAMATKRY